MAFQIGWQDGPSLRRLYVIGPLPPAALNLRLRGLSVSSGTHRDDESDVPDRPSSAMKGDPLNLSADCALADKYSPAMAGHSIGRNSGRWSPERNQMLCSRAWAIWRRIEPEALGDLVD
jgi:hypothetical protein